MVAQDIPQESPTPSPQLDVNPTSMSGVPWTQKSPLSVSGELPDMPHLRDPTSFRPHRGTGRTSLRGLHFLQTPQGHGHSPQTFRQAPTLP